MPINFPNSPANNEVYTYNGRSWTYDGVNSVWNANGTQGAPGIQGALGSQGEKGQKGDAGGPQGDQGFQGPQGAQGSQGPQGNQGRQGTQGAQGFQGVQGATGGPQGAQGTKGDKGDPGGPQGSQGAQGFQGVQGATGDQGAQGVQGDVGAKGDKGAQGQQGFQGVQGNQGRQGEKGQKGELGGPQGAQGVQGATGGSTITDETVASALYYPVLASATSGPLSSNVSSSKLQFQPSIGELSANIFASNSYIQYASNPSISSGTLTLDLRLANFFYVTLNQNITTLTINNTELTNNVSSFAVLFTADGTARSITWPASFDWPSGIAPSLTSTNGKKDLFFFITHDGGVNWYSFISGQNM